MLGWLPAAFIASRSPYIFTLKMSKSMPKSSLDSTCTCIIYEKAAGCAPLELVSFMGKLQKDCPFQNLVTTLRLLICEVFPRHDHIQSWLMCICPLCRHLPFSLLEVLDDKATSPFRARRGGSDCKRPAREGGDAGHLPS